MMTTVRISTLAVVTEMHAEAILFALTCQVNLLAKTAVNAAVNLATHSKRMAAATAKT